MKKIVLLFVLALLVYAGCSLPELQWPDEFAANFAGTASDRATLGAKSNYVAPRALAAFTSRLTAEGRDWRKHGVYVETLNTAEPVAMMNEDVPFNPASVIKLATTLAAFEKLGPNHRFHTDFFAAGEITPGGDLNGDLILLSGRDPAFSLNDAKQVGATLRQLGIARVNGGLVVIGDFNCNFKSQTDDSTVAFLQHSGISFRQPARLELATAQPRGRLLLSVESDSLLHIVQYLNAHSVNSIAELLAAHVGGPQSVKSVIVNLAGLAPDSVRISRGSGLEVNRMTPRDTVKMLRALFAWLDRYNLPPEAIMPIAGVDPSTVGRRFAERQFAGSVIGKTGTLYTTDGGVAALAGVMHTKSKGDLLFVVYDGAQSQYKQIKNLRDTQDDFLKDLMNECGGPAPSRSHSITHNNDRLTSRVLLAQ